LESAGAIASVDPLVRLERAWRRRRIHERIGATGQSETRIVIAVFPRDECSIDWIIFQVEEAHLHLFEAYEVIHQRRNRKLM
jgi:hypothetical protein